MLLLGRGLGFISIIFSQALIEDRWLETFLFTAAMDREDRALAHAEPRTAKKHRYALTYSPCSDVEWTLPTPEATSFPKGLCSQARQGLQASWPTHRLQCSQQRGAQTWATSGIQAFCFPLDAPLSTHVFEALAFQSRSCC